MKKSHKFLKITAVTAALAFSLSFVSAGCAGNGGAACFAQTEYTVSNGGFVTLSAGSGTYKLLGSVPEGVEVSPSGQFTVAAEVPDGTQVVLAATDGNNNVLATAIVTLSVPAVVPQITFNNLSEYLMNGEYASATAVPAYSVSYSLKEAVDGISVNSVTGRVSYAGRVEDGEEFTVVATARGGSASKKFYASVSDYVKAVNDTAVCEYGVGGKAEFVLDYPDSIPEQSRKVLGVTVGGRSTSDYTYDEATRTLSLGNGLLKELGYGENEVGISTVKNTVQVIVKCATYIATAEDLAAINNSREALAGYYIMVNDVDLTSYLSNMAKGWKPIGIYNDVTDGTAYDWAFAGTFDGNGHTVSGLFIDRSDNFAYNSGLFGYITSGGTVTGLGVRNAEGKTNKVRSYSGGFVGASAGIITNCWADVTVETGEAYRVVGGFVGRNEGTISNCYSLGGATGGQNVGAFCGDNMGAITDCYALDATQKLPFTGANNAAENSAVYATSEELSAADFTGWKGWTLQSGALPVLPSIAVEYGLKQIFITNTATTVTRGDYVQIAVAANPSDKLQGLELGYEITEGANGVFVDANGKIDTLNAQEHYCTVKAYVKDDPSIYDTYSFYIYDKVESVKFTDDMEREMSAGKYYRLTTEVKPDSADQQVVYTLGGIYEGITLEDGIIGIDRHISDCQIVINASSADGTFSDTLTVSVKGAVFFEGGNLILYRDQTSPAQFNMPQGVAAQVTKVLRFGKSVPFAVSGGAITVDRQYIDMFGTEEVPFDFITPSATYCGAVSVYDRSQVIEIGSVQDFENFKSDPANFDKIVVLTADLDFGGEKIISVGSHHLDTDFTGIFNGNGHAIKNVTIWRNDFSGSYISEEDGQQRGDYDVYRYHSSYYNVGFFSSLRGSVLNVNFQNVTASPLFNGTDGDVTGNFVGVVCGTNEGIIKNCTFTGCSVSAGGDIKGLVAGKNNGSIISCYQK